MIPPSPELRKVGELVGLDFADTPGFGRFVCGEHCRDGQTGEMELCTAIVYSMCGDDPIQRVDFHDCGLREEDDGGERRHVPGLSSITDPREALARIYTAIGSKT